MGNWTVSAWPILASAALKSTLVLGAAWLITFLLRGRSAAARHMVWTAAAAALLALPLLTVALPALHLAVANAVLPADTGLGVPAQPRNHGGGCGRRGGGGRTHGGRTESRRPRRRARMDGKDALMLLWMAGIAAGLLQMLAAWRCCGGRGGRREFRRTRARRTRWRAVWGSSIRCRYWRRRRGCR